MRVERHLPELPEVECYRVLGESRALGRRVVGVELLDADYLRNGMDSERLEGALHGKSIEAVRRVGKVLLLDFVAEQPAQVCTLALRFGMTGRLVVDDHPAIDRLMYSPVGADRRWDRFELRFADGGNLRVSDPRRLGSVEIDPDLSRLGPDALGLSRIELASALAGSAAPLKSRLLDQSKVAGIGNLIADECLWRAGLSPLRVAGGVTEDELGMLHRRVGSTIRMLIRRGGSHCGDLMPQRRAGGLCPMDKATLRRSVVGGRTTWWCPLHQR